jgi:hypothetical protein
MDSVLKEVIEKAEKSASDKVEQNGPMAGIIEDYEEMVAAIPKELLKIDAEDRGVESTILAARIIAACFIVGTSKKQAERLAAIAASCILPSTSLHRLTAEEIIRDARKQAEGSIFAQFVASQMDAPRLLLLRLAHLLLEDVEDTRKALIPMLVLNERSGKDYAAMHKAAMAGE